MVEDNIVVVECVNNIDDKLACDVNMNPNLNNSNVGSIHLQCDDDLLKNDEFHLVIIETQIKKWKNEGGFFVVNDNMFVDLVNPQMLRCIICMFHQVINNILNQNYIFCKGLIKYSKTNICYFYENSC
jgi:hypothetical protein